MKIRYEFCNEDVEIEVSEEWAAVLAELDRQEYNSNQRETRRHCSLDAFNSGNDYLPSEDDVEGDVLEHLDHERLTDAIATLLPQQQELVRRVYFNREKIVSIAVSENVSEAAIRDRLKKIHVRLKNFLKNF